jgi:hypothetical protein
MKKLLKINNQTPSMGDTSMEEMEKSKQQVE